MITETFFHKWQSFKGQFLGKFEKKETYFLAIFNSFYPPISSNVFQRSSNFQKSYFFVSFMGYLRIIITAHVFHFWHSSKKKFFFENCFNFKIKFTSWRWHHSKNLMRLSAYKIFTYFQNLVGFAPAPWESVQTVTLFQVW